MLQRTKGWHDLKSFDQTTDDFKPLISSPPTMAYDPLDDVPHQLRRPPPTKLQDELNNEEPFVFQEPHGKVEEKEYTKAITPQRRLTRF